MSTTPASTVKALCIFTTTLGHKTETERLIRALERIPSLQSTHVIVAPEDYSRYPAPRWARMMGPWEGQYVARQKAASYLDGAYDMMFLNVWEYAVAFYELARRLPTAMAMDAVPATIDAQRREQGLGGAKRWIAHQVHNRSFARAAPAVDIFLPKNSECLRALEQEYRIPQERCFLMRTPQDLSAWTPGSRTYSSPARLLFVGNDFTRKGGELLLRMYVEHLAGKCTLAIASNDPTLPGRQLPAGVELIRGRNREQLLEVYQSSDIFVFPSRQDYGPEVVAEALAAGLPCLIGDVHGAGDLVQEGETGFILPRDAPPALWAERVQTLLANPAELERMSRSARAFAERELDFETFAALTARVVDRLRRGKYR